MNLLYLFICAAGIGLAFAAPIGPVGMTAFAQLSKGKDKSAKLLGAGACASDFLCSLVYIWIACTFASEQLKELQANLDGISAEYGPWFAMILLLAFALYMWKSAEAKPQDISDRRSFLLGFSITLINAKNQIAFLGMAITVALTSGGDIAHPAVYFSYALGILVGALIGWFAMFKIFQQVKERFYKMREENVSINGEFQFYVQRRLAILCVGFSSVFIMQIIIRNLPF